jgi:DNA topoisomerase-1
MNLVIVESPTKAKTISGFLSQEDRVLSSYGHIRDLPEDKFGIDIENDFKPNYTILPKAKRTIQLLKKETQKARLVILATDEDREGEAIAYHLTYLLNLRDKKPYQRIVFHEITKSAIEEALKSPRKIDMNLVDAQQTRRILDRIVGYKLSPFLWKKVARGLSAGRVQSVAVRLVMEREKEIKNFIPQEYWTVEALLKKIDKNTLHQFKALLVKEGDKLIPKLGIKTKKEAEKIVKDLKGAEYKVTSVDKKETKRNPLPPFTTSTLQQEAWQRFRFPAKITMRIAQQLYEKGFITYHRTDSLNLSNLSLFSAKKYIIENYGKNYWAGFLRKYKTKVKGAQEAHEAIRPSYPNKEPSSFAKAPEDKRKLDDSQFKLYDLIWRRFIACQMSQAVFDSTALDISAKNYIFRATGQILKFDGFLKVYPIKYEEVELPPLEINEILELIKLIPSQHFTQPPPRYSEATLIKALEENGIGRPSTYAPILSTIQEKNYIEKDENRKFRPTEIGTVVNDLLVAHFPEIVDIKFTAGMEEDLDKVAEGEKKWVPVIREFYQPFEENLQKKYQEVSKKDITEKPTRKKCPKCGNQLLIRLGKFGKFYACSKFPKCRYTESLKENVLGVKCPRCEKGEITEKRTKKNKIFYGCNQYPKCNFALWDKPTGEICPKCKSLLVQTKRGQIKCSNVEFHKNGTEDDFQKKSSPKNCSFELKKGKNSANIAKE